MSYELYDWQARFLREGLTFGLRLEFIELFRPHVKVKLPFQISDQAFREPSGPNDPKHIKELVDWEIVLGASEVHEVVETLRSNPGWLTALPSLLPSFTSLLLEALDLMRQLEGADDHSDGSYWHQPSIAEHPQNQRFRDWTALIDLTRDAFLAAATTDAGTARAEVERWLAYPYPLFRRLAFFAATETDLFAPNVSVQWLLSHQNWWLWSVETEREALRLMVKLASVLTSEDELSLLSAILHGPPRDMFSEDAGEEKLDRIVNREIWLRLSKYRASIDRDLTGEAATVLARISQSFPEWELAPDQSDEFPVWMGDGVEDWHKRQNSPKEQLVLEQWLLTEREGMTNDDWSDRCKDDFSVAISALVNLGQRKHWPIQRWRTALQVWSDQSLALQSWDLLKDLLPTADSNFIAASAQPLSWWLQIIGKVFTEGESQFFQLIRYVLTSQKHEGFDSGDDPTFKAINHPVGQVTDAVFRWWYRQGLEDGQGLKDEPRGIYSTLCDPEIASFRYGRIILATNLIALFRVDREWTERHIIQRFNWTSNAEEARVMWCGFLLAPRLYLPVLAALKPQLLETARHYSALGQFAEQYANLLTFIALEAPEPFMRRELAIATLQLPAQGLARCARSLVQGLDGAAEKRVEYWQNRVRPYLKEIWPKSIDTVTSSIANSFVRLCMKTDAAFPDAVSTLKPWLSSASQRDVTLHQFSETHLAKRFPDAALTFLDIILKQQEAFFLVENLKVPLDEIRQENPNLETDPRFERLMRYVRQVGG